MQPLKPLIVVFLCLVLPPLAPAQDSTEPAEEDGGHTAAGQAVTSYEDWSVQCLESTESGEEKCVLFQHLKVESGQRLLTMQVSRLPSQENQQSAMALVITVPLGVHLPSGIQLRMDGGTPIELVYERCDQDGCYAGKVLGDSLLEAMMQGDRSQVMFNNLTGKSIAATLSLRGFGEGFRALGTS